MPVISAVYRLTGCSFAPLLRCSRSLTLSAALIAAPGLASGIEDFDPAFALSFDTPMPEVLSTARLRQPKSRVPGTTTVITGDTIRELGILTLVETFRLVPGMTVAYVGSNQPVTSYHGTVAYYQRRLQVLIDGRSAVRSSLSDVDWNAMPVPLEEIERIEVSRGPNSAAYGINAFLGTINIITKAPEDTAGVSARVTSGSRGHKDYYASVGNVYDSSSWRLSYNRREADGFDYQVRFLSSGREEADFHNGYVFKNINLSSNLAFNDRQSLELRAGYTDVLDEEDSFRFGEGFGAVTQPDVEGEDYYAMLRWNYRFSDDHFVHLQSSYQRFDREQRWFGCPDIPVLPGFCSFANQSFDEQKLDFELQHTVSFTPDVRLVSGLGYREDSVESDTYFNGEQNNYQSRVFANLEYTPWYWVTLNVGANWERTAALDRTFFSPRVASNFHLTPNQTLRFVYSKAVRTPDALEQFADWGYRAEGVQPDAYGFLEGQRLIEFQSPGGYGVETLRSREVSYFGQFHLGRAVLSTEVRYFYDHVRDLISGRLNVDRWDLENNVALDQQGVELETSLHVNQTELRVNYGYMDQRGDYTGTPIGDPSEEEKFISFETRLTARHMGSLAWIQRYPGDVTTSAAYYFVEEFKEGSFNRWDFRVAKGFHMPRFSYDVAFVLQHYRNDNPLLSASNNLDSRNQLYAQLGVRF